MSQIQYDLEGVIFNIQRYSLHDGPGIRTIPFFKGCPLACKWCSNPESQHIKPELIYKENECIHCSSCIMACPEQAISLDNPYYIDRDRCTQCGLCVQVCPTGALEIKGKKVTVEEVIRELKKDENLYRRVGGGITLSGGEPLAQPDFARELLKACQSHGWHTAIETTAFAPTKVIDEVFPYVDLALTDIKAMDPVIHKVQTGVDNSRILKNLIRIASITKTVVRIPIIPGVNDNQEEIKHIAEFVKQMPNVNTIHLLPYHTFGENKYQLLGRKYSMKEIPALNENSIEALKLVVESMGFSCQIGG